MGTSIWDAEASSSRASRSRVADDDTVYVAVGKDFEENKLNLLWAVENFPGKRFCILHVHQPAKMIPLVGGTFPVSRLEQNEMSEFQEFERKILRKILDDYLLLCDQVDVHAEKLCVEMDDIGKGIVELIYQYNIKKLVMGAAANKHYSEEMMDLKSKKAKYVQQRVLLSCQIWEGDSTCSSNGFGDSASVMQQRTEESGLELEISQLEEDNRSLEAWEESSIDQLYAQLKRAMLEAEKFKREAFEESIRRGEAEMTAIKATCRAKLLESLYAGELRNRKETEEALAREKEDHHRTKKQLDEERVVTMDQRLFQQIRDADLDNRMNEMNDKILSAVEQHKKYKKERDELQVERDELQVERDNLLKLTEELSNKQAEDASSSQMHQFLPDFSLSETEEATCNRDPLLRIGEGRYGNIYKGSLHRTPVAIEVLNQDGMQGPLDFQQEVDLLGKLRHPNLALLIGACSEACALIYEYLPNGSLEDRLCCKDNTPPLPWQVRIRIATELCSVLVFLHSSSPHSIVHGDLKSGNVLLDANFTCELSDFGICRALSHHESSQYHESDSRGSFIHLDPYFLRTGELSPKSDTYSFGIILLQLLTGKSALSIVTEIRDVIDEENLNSFLDPLAGDWPFVQAKQLTHLALNCCATNQNRRPDLGSEVCRVLEPMRLSCLIQNQYSEESEQPPSHFFCPILQEVMQDPCVAADGFTYEREALTDWLESGHNTSPMTNLQLQNLNLIPNLFLRSAIQEWMEIHNLPQS